MYPKFLSLISTVAMLFSMGILMFSTPPLLVLKHDTPTDARFIRGIFNVLYVAMIASGVGATLAYAWAGEAMIAGALAAITVFSFMVRWTVIRRMDALRLRLAEGDRGAVPPFRKTHLFAIGVNVAQLATLVCCLSLVRF